MMMMVMMTTFTIILARMVVVIATPIWHCQVAVRVVKQWGLSLGGCHQQHPQRHRCRRDEDQWSGSAVPRSRLFLISVVYFPNARSIFLL